MTTEALLPCPFCGNPPKSHSITTDGSLWHIGCEHEDCWVQPKSEQNKKLLCFEVWNTRFGTSGSGLRALMYEDGRLCQDQIGKMTTFMMSALSSPPAPKLEEIEND